MTTQPLNHPANQLVTETSRYLLQHAHNPVHWYPWGPTAIELARKQEKPILLSIGYSACHWCHVMMHESFEDPDVAATMNRLFINIKVDKEERPDLDKIYQTAHQLLLGHAGGWPLTMFLSPTSLVPYFGGTYFPKNPEVIGKNKQTTPGFVDLLHRLNEIFYHQKERMKQQEEHTLAVIKAISQMPVASDTPLAENLIQQAIEVLKLEFDPLHGGFGSEAKFPNCPTLNFLLQAKDPLQRHIAIATLDKMAHGGIYDQLGCGFFRYTVDRDWHIPHFEKMLYDNAQLLSLYAQAYNLTNHQLYRQIAIETGNWMAKELQAPDGGFYGSLDADSEGEEGHYYTWDMAELKTALNPEEFKLLHKHYKLDHKPNFHMRWHLIAKESLPTTEELNNLKLKLSQIRELRIKPEIDTKIMTAWNGLAIAGLSDAGQRLQYKPFLELAEKTIKFIQKHLYVDQQLYATLQNNQPKIGAFIDDYAYLLHGILTFINNNPKDQHIEFCKILADDMIENFYDHAQGGFFFNANNAEQLFYRPKTFTDDATPSGNGLACVALLKLGKLLNNHDYLAIARHTINAAQAYLNEAPELHLSMCHAYSMLHS